jgi:hypothetical protein
MGEKEENKDKRGKEILIIPFLFSTMILLFYPKQQQ